MKRLLSMVVMLVMLATALVGCGEAPVSSVSSAATTQQSASSTTLVNNEEQVPTGKTAKYVFYMIGDGMGSGQRTLAEYYQKYKTGDADYVLGMNAMPVSGIVTTHSLNSYVTDSAAGGTALATGRKTNSGVISMSPDGTEEYKTLLEAAQERGMATGLVTSVSITHATPATFGAHAADRGDETEVADSYLAKQIDYLAGGGLINFIPEESGGDRTDGRDLTEEYAAQGYTVHTGKNDFDQADFSTIDKYLGLFADDYLTDEITQINQGRTSPELSELLSAGIDVLSKNDTGFFIMCEGGQIDEACHYNDTASTLQEVLAFDKAVQVAVDFYNQYPEDTLIVVVADHETGGLALGYNNYRVNFEPLDSIKGSVVQQIHPAYRQSREEYYQAIEQTWGVTVTDEDKAETERRIQNFDVVELYSTAFPGVPEEVIQNVFVHMMAESGYVISHILTRETKISWTSQAHTGDPVPLTAIGTGADMLSGYMDNTDVALRVAEIMGVTL